MHGIVNPGGRRGRTPSAEDHMSAEYIAFEITYHCKHCDKEWTKLSEREWDVPREYGLVQD